MVKVFIHPRTPLVRRERAKEGMRVACALCFPTLMKLPDPDFELFLFAPEISRIGDDQLLVGGVVPGKWFVVAIDGPDEGSEQAAQQDPRPYEPAGSEIERCRAMRHHLGDFHFAPLPLGRWLKFVDARDHFVNRICLE